MVQLHARCASGDSMINPPHSNPTDFAYGEASRLESICELTMPAYILTFPAKFHSCCATPLRCILSNRPQLNKYLR